ncbi:MAG: hypothetical protein JSS30_02205 [Verrucomicrobia bacterium]|nr:hypothetical protein [Verrucomicrobiota bacterium]
MICPVERTPPTASIPQVDFPHGSRGVRFPDKLLSAQRQSPILKALETALGKIWSWLQKTPALRGVRTFLARVYDWLLRNVFFLFYDEEEETNNRYLIKLDKFYDLYLVLAPAATQAGREKVRDKFGSLDRGLRDMLRKQLANVLSADRKDLTPEQIEERVEQVIEDPFLIFDAEHGEEEVNPLEDHHVPPFARAICAVRDKL